ncbi:hypothetical protein S101446_03288 (plasmid) [Komagataeibacter europaeus]|nr:hypothetical protein S101446_03288 [Komagataeibacter europaeus]
MDPMLAAHIANGKAAFEIAFYNLGAKSGRVGPSTFPTMSIAACFC